jgi:hypothetical protein
MDDNYIEKIDKNKHSNNLSQKFRIINSKETINNDKNILEWIKLNNFIKDNDILNISLSLMYGYKIIMKIGIKNNIIREYNISNILLTIPGFIKYLCYYTCNNDKTNNLHILLMKEYMSDIKSYKWNKHNFKLLKSLLKQIFLSLYIAFKKYGFIHNDIHYGNFLLKKQKKDIIIYKYNDNEFKINSEGYSIIITDFENSIFDKEKKVYNIICSDFMNIINFIDSVLKISIKNSNLIINLLSNKKDFDILLLLELIDKLEFIEYQQINLNYEDILNDNYI